MKFYQLKLALSPLINKGIPYASGRTLEQFDYFEYEGKIYNESYIEDAPMFDYFSLVSMKGELPYDWLFLDVYEYSEINYPMVNGFFISKKFKECLTKFIIDKPFKFYESRLMYQGDKYEYYIFQLCGKFYNNISFKMTTWQYSKLARKDLSKDYLPDINNFELYNLGYPEGFEQPFVVFPKKAVLKNYCDLMFMYSVEKFAISERLKDAIIEAGITGLEITPIDHIEFEFEEGVPISC